MHRCPGGRADTKAPLRLVFGLVIAKAEAVTHGRLELPEVQTQAGFEDCLGVEAIDDAFGDHMQVLLASSPFDLGSGARHGYGSRGSNAYPLFTLDATSFLISLARR